jgi:hypothetical protein
VRFTWRYRAGARRLGDTIAAEAQRGDVAADVERIVTDRNERAHERMASKLGS